MNTAVIIPAITAFALAGVLLVLAVIHFAERGFLLNNAYIYASLKERENMDKKPYYRQSAIVFSLLSAVFFIVGLSVVTQIDEILLAEIPVMASAIVYAVVSSVRISKQMKKRKANLTSAGRSRP